MSWKLYTTLTIASLRFGIAACFGPFSTNKINDQLETISHLLEILACLKQSYALHPHFLTNTYGDTKGYLRSHLSEQNWLLLVSIMESSHKFRLQTSANPELVKAPQLVDLFYLVNNHLLRKWLKYRWGGYDLLIPFRATIATFGHPDNQLINFVYFSQYVDYQRYLKITSFTRKGIV